MDFHQDLDRCQGLPFHNHGVALVLLRGHQASKPDRRKAQDDDVDEDQDNDHHNDRNDHNDDRNDDHNDCERMTNQLLFVSSGELSGVGW